MRSKCNAAPKWSTSAWSHRVTGFPMNNCRYSKLYTTRTQFTYGIISGTHTKVCQLTRLWQTSWPKLCWGSTGYGNVQQIDQPRTTIIIHRCTINRKNITRKLHPWPLPATAFQLAHPVRARDTGTKGRIANIWQHTRARCSLHRTR